jgi:hypothetical protein
LSLPIIIILSSKDGDGQGTFFRIFVKILEL